jgi:hypothetical protein
MLQYTSSGFFRPGLPTKILYLFLIFPIRDTCLARLIGLDLITLINLLSGEDKLSSSLCIFFLYPVTILCISCKKFVE